MFAKIQTGERGIIKSGKAFLESGCIRFKRKNHERKSRLCHLSKNDNFSKKFTYSNYAHKNKKYLLKHSTKVLIALQLLFETNFNIHEFQYYRQHFRSSPLLLSWKMCSWDFLPEGLIKTQFPNDSKCFRQWAEDCNCDREAQISKEEVHNSRLKRTRSHCNGGLHWHRQWHRSQTCVRKINEDQKGENNDAGFYGGVAYLYFNGKTQSWSDVAWSCFGHCTNSSGHLAKAVEVKLCKNVTIY